MSIIYCTKAVTTHFWISNFIPETINILSIPIERKLVEHNICIIELGIGYVLGCCGPPVSTFGMQNLLCKDQRSIKEMISWNDEDNKCLISRSLHKINYSQCQWYIWWQYSNNCSQSLLQSPKILQPFEYLMSEKWAHFNALISE